MITIILAGIENPGNLGAVARVMKNFGFAKLVLLNPNCSITQDARDRAKHAQDILDDCKTISEKSLSKFDLLIASTARLGTDYNLPRSALDLEDVVKKINAVPPKTKIGILFGPESTGLSNALIQKADITFTINTTEAYPSLNLSHAVAVTLHALSNAPKRTQRFTPITQREKHELMKLIKKRIKQMPLRTDGQRLTQEKLWRNILGKAMLTKREAQALFGFLKKS
ncbi:MAG: TrmH family RNA methyltransferase [Candidatus Woesearchaeota archaeon]